MFKLWAITSASIAIAMSFSLWARLVRFEMVLIVAVATATVTLAYSTPEPYAAVLLVLVAPVLVLANAVRRRSYQRIL
jgi:galactan 5-O-arabinofuranosyltransferase